MSLPINKIKKPVVKIIILLLFLASQGYSQVKVLNLNEAISLAIRNNSDLVLARLEKLKADEKVSEVYSENLVPSLSLSSTYTRALKKNYLTVDFGGGVTQRISVGTDNTITTNLQVTESIPFLGTPIFSGIRIAQYYQLMQQEVVNQTEYKVKADVTKSYYNVQLLKEVVDVNRQSLSNAEENLRVVEARYKVGTALEFDYLRAKVRVETLRPGLIQSQNNLELAKKVLRSAIGLKDNQDVDVTGTLTYDSTEVYGTTANLINKISEENVNIRQLRLSRNINEELVRVDKASFLPKFYLFGQLTNQAAENDGKPIWRYPFLNSINVGIGMSWDLNFFANAYKKNQAEIDVKKTDEQILNVKDKLKTQAESILLRMEDAKNRIVSQRENVAMAERGLELANISFKSGVINQIDVFDAELLVSQVRLSYIQAIFDYLNARAELEQLLEK
jgi:outer membrane protein TolC